MLMWKECLRVLPLLLFHEKRIAVATTDNGTNMIKRNERWRNRKMALCCSSHAEQGDKEHNERVDNSNNIDLLPRVLRAV